MSTPPAAPADPTVRVLRAPVSRPDTSATGRPERPDPCADPPTVTIDPTRVMPAVPGVPGDDPVAATVPRLRSVTLADGGAVGDGRVPAAASALGATLLHQVAPLLVVLGLGPGPGMVFFVAWQVVTAVDLTAVWMLGRPGGTSRRRLLVTFGPALALVAAGAAPLLGVFGPDYAAAADVLRVLLLGAAFRLVIVHELGALEAAGRAWSSARLHLYTTVPTLLVVGLSVAAVAATGLSGLSSVTAGTVLLPVAAAYALVQVACCVAVLVLFPTWSRTRPEEQP